jgi:hypothetical protein
VTFHFDETRGRLQVRGALANAQWADVVQAIREHGITDVEAGGITDDGVKRLSSCDGITALSHDADHRRELRHSCNHDDTREDRAVSDEARDGRGHCRTRAATRACVRCVWKPCPA